MSLYLLLVGIIPGVTCPPKHTSVSGRYVHQYLVWLQWLHFTCFSSFTYTLNWDTKWQTLIDVCERESVSVCVCVCVWVGIVCNQKDWSFSLCWHDIMTNTQRYLTTAEVLTSLLLDTDTLMLVSQYVTPGMMPTKSKYRDTIHG